MESKKTKLQQIREEIIAGFRAILEKHSLDEIDVTDCGSTPVIWPSADDQDFDTYTLDRVYIGKDNVLIDSSSSDTGRTDRAEELGTDTLVYILEFLEENEELIWQTEEDADEESENPPFLFTVNSSGKKVKFSPGNLYWDGKKFCFEKHQYDYPTIRDPDHIGHFFWSKDASKAIAPKYNDRKARCNNTFFAADGGAIEGFTVLSKDEWKYLIDHALEKVSSKPKIVKIAGKKCVIFKPDEFSGTVADSYTAETWAAAEASGLVALPFAGYYLGSSFSFAGSYGYYWSSTPYEGGVDYARFELFFVGVAYTTDFNFRNFGYSVRLVSVQDSL